MAKRPRLTEEGASWARPRSLRGWLGTQTQLTETQRRLLAAKCADLGNIAAGSLIFGTLIREEALTVLSILLGILLLIVAYGLSVVLSRPSPV